MEDNRFTDLFSYTSRHIAPDDNRWIDVYSGVTLLKDTVHPALKTGTRASFAIVDFRTGMVVFENVEVSEAGKHFLEVLGEVSFRAEWILNNNKGRS